jgi:hypothetical protein
MDGVAVMSLALLVRGRLLSPASNSGAAPRGPA